MAARFSRLSSGISKSKESSCPPRADRLPETCQASYACGRTASRNSAGVFPAFARLLSASKAAVPAQLMSHLKAAEGGLLRRGKAARWYCHPNFPRMPPNVETPTHEASSQPRGEIAKPPNHSSHMSLLAHPLFADTLASQSTLDAPSFAVLANSARIVDWLSAVARPPAKRFAGRGRPTFSRSTSGRGPTSWSCASASVGDVRNAASAYCCRLAADAGICIP